MIYEKRVSIQWIKAIFASAKALGINTEEILTNANIEINFETNQPAYLSLQQTQVIWQQAEKLSRHEHFGLMMGQAFRPSYFHVVAYLAMTSRNLKQAYEHFIKFLPLISEAAALSLYYESDQVCITFTPQADQTPFSRHQYESALTLLLTFTRSLIGDAKLAPKRVLFQHSAGPDLALYKQIFSITPEFKQSKTCIYFPAQYLEKALADSDVSLNRLHLSHANQLLTNHLKRSWRDHTYLGIHQLGVINISKNQLAQHLNVSPRTLQRRLSEEDTNFQQVLDEYKAEQAHNMIAYSEIAFKKIALELGFAEASTFYRAVNRWFKCTPKALRQAGQEKVIQDSRPV